jgi:DNA-binding transcriptional ArsR family regulator
MSEAPAPAFPLLDAFLSAIGHPLRWAILRELSAGEPLMVLELAQRLGRDKSVISKHLATLRRGGAVVIGRGRLYQIPAPYLADPAQGLVDYGHCLLRFARPTAPSA